MKLVVIQEPIMQPDITKEDIEVVWKQLEKRKEVEQLEIFQPKEYPKPEELHTMIGDADAVFGLWIDESCINEGFLAKHPKLKYIATLGHGFETFDILMTKRRGILISNTIYGAQTIAEYAFSMLLDICHNVSFHSDHIKRTDWAIPFNEASFCKTFLPQKELFQKTVGIIGLGSIGYAFAKMAQGFGMRLMAYNRHIKQGEAYDFIEQVPLEKIWSACDVISLHIPYSADSKNMINKESIEKMKDGVILINTARGGLIVEEDLANALQSGKVYAAGLDVLREEPPKSGSPLLACKNAYITGHIAWLTRESRLRACQMAIENFVSYLEGQPVSIINV